MPSLFVLAVFPAALLIAAATDIYEFKIPNWVSVVLISAYGLAGFLLSAPLSEIVEGFLLGAAMLALGFGFYAAKLLGGGDAKLLAATVPWIGLAELVNFLIAMVCAGAALALFLFVFRKVSTLPIYAQAEWLMRMHQNQKDMPYGVAIAAGGLSTFTSTPFFQLAFGV